HLRYLLLIISFPLCLHSLSLSFFFNSPPTTELYTLSLHDALPIYTAPRPPPRSPPRSTGRCGTGRPVWPRRTPSGNRTPSSASRSEEHTSELQSRGHLVCRLLLEKKKKKYLQRQKKRKSEEHSDFD